MLSFETVNDCFDQGALFTQSVHVREDNINCRRSSGDR